jgi:hypothetical protein
MANLVRLNVREHFTTNFIWLSVGNWGRGTVLAALHRSDMKFTAEDKPRRVRAVAAYLQCDCLRGQIEIL